MFLNSQVSAQDIAPSPNRSAFTLVELLVSAMLIVLMLTLFAVVFQGANTAMSKARGITENDQRARSVTIVLRGDLDKRTFRSVVPFEAGEGPPPAGDINFEQLDFQRRRGYFYVSENNPADDTDDVLQFTALATITTENSDQTPYFGRAATLDQNLAQHPDQPDADDGNIAPDGTSQSAAAEITYFLRKGRLYRRVLLIRQPLPLDEIDDAQPNNGASPPVNYFDTDPNTLPSYPADFQVLGSFWGDFDFSAQATVTVDGMGGITANDGAKFHGIKDLDNTGLLGVFPLARPFNRFGHNHQTGQPKEYVGPQNAKVDFIGRFTQEETSFNEDRNNNGRLDAGEDVNGNGQLDAFRYPQSFSLVNGNPINPMADGTLTLGTDGVVNAFRGGSRRAEDLLLSNVHAFDIKVWDEAADLNGDGFAEQGFVDVGHAAPGHFSRQSVSNVPYGSGRIFDTWHPQIDIDRDSQNDPPPFSLRDTANVPKPLKLIQITVRYLDVSSNQMRDVTIQHSLVDP